MIDSRYRKARVAAAMTQEHLAVASGVSVSTIRRIEKGGIASPESRRALAAVLGMEANEAMTVPEIRLVNEPVYERFVIRKRFRGMAVAAHAIWYLLAAFSVFMAMHSHTGVRPMTDRAGLWLFFAVMSTTVVAAISFAAIYIEGRKAGMVRQGISSMLLALFGGTISLVASVGFLSAGVFDIGFGCVVLAVAAMEALLLRVMQHSVVVGPATKRLGGSFRSRYVRCALTGKTPVLAVA